MSQHIITIYTDASFCPVTKVGGWGAWVKFGDGESRTFSAPFKVDITSSTEAELMAIANAVYLVKKNLDAKNKTLVVVTDSRGAIDFIAGDVLSSNKNKNKAKNLKKIAFAINSMVDGHCKLVMKKVKAHSNKDGKRSYVNGLVDRAAKAAMKKKRSEVTIKSQEEAGF